MHGLYPFGQDHESLITAGAMNLDRFQFPVGEAVTVTFGIRITPCGEVLSAIKGGLFRRERLAAS